MAGQTIYSGGGLRRSLGFVLALGALGSLAPSTADAASPPVVVTAILNGQSAAASSDAHPAEIYPSGTASVRVTVANRGEAPFEVASVRLQGEVLDLPLFSYDSTIDLTVAPHSSKSLTFPVSMDGVGSQATGLVSASITALSADGAVVSTQSIVTYVHGSLRSVYGLFGLAVFALTLSSLVLALVAMARHRLPANRWLRAVRFAIPGFGIGLVMTFTLAAIGVFTPGPGHWLPVLIGTMATGLAFGYLTPAPNEEEFGDEDDDILLAEIVVVDEDPRDAVAGVEATAPVIVAPSGPVPDGRATVAP